MNATKMTNLQDFIAEQEEIARRTGVQIENVQIEGDYCYVAYNCPAAHRTNLLEDIHEILSLIAIDLMTDEKIDAIYIDGQQVNIQQYLQTMQTTTPPMQGECLVCGMDFEIDGMQQCPFCGAVGDDIITNDPLDETGELTDEQFATLLFKPRDYACVERMGW